MKIVAVIGVRLAASGLAMWGVATAWLRPPMPSVDWPLWVALGGALWLAPAGMGLLNHVFHDEPADVGRTDPVCLCLRALTNVGLVLAAGLPAGLGAGIAVLPWLAMTAVLAARASWWLCRHPGTPERWLVAAAATNLAVGALWLAAERGGVRLLGYDSVTERVTAAHFHYAGFFLPLTAALLLRERPGAPVILRIGALGVLLGFPAVALGILARRWGLPPEGEGVVAAAFALAAGALGLFQMKIGWACREKAAALLLNFGGAALAAGSLLALLFALRPWIGAGTLTWPVMWACHGSLQALGFAGPSVLGWRVRVREAMAFAPRRRRHGASHAVWLPAFH